MRPFGQLGMGAIGSAVNASMTIAGGGAIIVIFALLGCGRSNELRSLNRS
jgi:ABC-type proline/glycine betaine transport system ATPase subunit